MAERLQVYRCEICGNIVEVVHGGVGDLICCNEDMQLLVEKSTDAGKEKHVPVVEEVAGGVHVKVGSVPHPMEPAHYIEWIEVIVDGRACRQFLKPGEAPEATFTVKTQGLVAREYCSIHGLWGNPKA